jgi:hypothetical protein
MGDIPLDINIGGAGQRTWRYAVAIMFRKQESQDDLAGGLYFFGMGGYHHALRDRSSTGSAKFVFTFDLHDTQTAGGRGFLELG